MLKGLPCCSPSPTPYSYPALPLFHSTLSPSSHPYLSPSLSSPIAFPFPLHFSCSPLLSLPNLPFLPPSTPSPFPHHSFSFLILPPSLLPSLRLTTFSTSKGRAFLSSRRPSRMLTKPVASSWSSACSTSRMVPVRPMPALRGGRRAEVRMPRRGYGSCTEFASDRRGLSCSG